jgi:hypothetical protein
LLTEMWVMRVRCVYKSCKIYHSHQNRILFGDVFSRLLPVMCLLCYLGGILGARWRTGLKGLRNVQLSVAVVNRGSSNWGFQPSPSFRLYPFTQPKSVVLFIQVFLRKREVYVFLKPYR